ncbi:CDP-diacylglycerol--glycerol-3-phosphate 3-phosphatidyltransferase [Olsenella massiliensis]|uniref:CDP-diacylglycerol--glycerol-3-phosphate 3-phosphatidyltransferase n=1 Tax=Olsenella massiliensis TaxID=1622075 RepID=UPI00071C4D71
MSSRARSFPTRTVRHVATKGIWTPANIVTCLRVALVPAWLFAAELAGAPVPGEFQPGLALVAVLFVLLSLTDKLDGYLARSRDEVTTFGKFLDPIADKLVVVVSLCFLLEMGWVSPWVLLVVVAREFLVSGLRMVVASEGEVVAASDLGKWKTATTMVAISGLLLVMALPQGTYVNLLATAFRLCLAAAVVLTIWSGLDYFMKSWHVIVRKG